MTGIDRSARRGRHVDECARPSVATSLCSDSMPLFAMRTASRPVRNPDRSGGSVARMSRPANATSARACPGSRRCCLAGLVIRSDAVERDPAFRADGPTSPRESFGSVTWSGLLNSERDPDRIDGLHARRSREDPAQDTVGVRQAVPWNACAVRSLDGHRMQRIELGAAGENSLLDEANGFPWRAAPFDPGKRLNTQPRPRHIGQRLALDPLFAAVWGSPRWLPGAQLAGCWKESTGSSGIKRGMQPPQARGARVPLEQVRPVFGGKTCRQDCNIMQLNAAQGAGPHVAGGVKQEAPHQCGLRGVVVDPGVCLAGNSSSVMSAVR